MKPHRWSCTFALSLSTAVVSALVAPNVARAEVTAEDRAAAEVFFREGLALVDEGKLPEGCRKFEASQKLDPQLGTLLYLATCHEQEGKTASAYADFTAARAQAERAQKAERVAQAQAGVERTEAKLSRLSIVAEQPAPGLVVRVNGRELKLLGEALPYDPGQLAIEATAPGHERYATSFELAPGPASESLTIPPLVPSAGGDGGAVSSGGSSLPWIVGGAGLGVTALGLVFGGVALAESSAASDQCNGALCSQAGLDRHAAANGWAWASNVTVVLGLAAVGVGAYLLLSDDDGPPPVQAGAIVLPDGSFAAGIGGVW